MGNVLFRSSAMSKDMYQPLAYFPRPAPLPPTPTEEDEIFNLLTYYNGQLYFRYKIRHALYVYKCKYNFSTSIDDDNNSCCSTMISK